MILPYGGKDLFSLAEANVLRALLLIPDAVKCIKEFHAVFNKPHYDIKLENFVYSDTLRLIDYEINRGCYTVKYAPLAIHLDQYCNKGADFESLAYCLLMLYDAIKRMTN